MKNYKFSRFVEIVFRFVVEFSEFYSPVETLQELVDVVHMADAANFED